MSNRRKLPHPHGPYQDQLQAAAADAWQRTATAPGRRREAGDESELPPAIRKVSDQLHQAIGRWRDGQPGRVCPHKDPRRAEPTHWFAAVPDLRMCDRCAAPFVADFMAAVDQCDLCHGDYPHDVLTLIALNVGHFIVHTALCDDCYPEGADAPVMTRARP